MNYNVTRLMPTKKKVYYFKLCNEARGGCGKRFKPISATQLCDDCKKKRKEARSKK